MLAAGDLVGASYRIVRLIGHGGMGEVYEALHEPLSRRVALKKIRGDHIASDELLTRFRREAEASAALGHPNIVQVTDFVLEDERSPAMVMELLEGRTLRDLVSGALRLEPSRAVFISLQILSGLAAAHDAGIIHRDVKPANVFLQKTLALRDHVKLLDFGVAKLNEVDTGSKAAIPVTRRGSVLGTRAYMAPEQASGEVVDARADLYAVGATLYYALSGWKPRDSDPSEKRAPLSTVAKDVPSLLAAIVDKALSDRPKDRFSSAEEMAEALAEFSNAGMGVHPSLPPPVHAHSSTTTTAAAYQSATVEAAPMTVRDARFVGDVLPSGSIRSASPVIEDKKEEPIQVITKKMAPAQRPIPPNPFADTVPVPELEGSSARSARTHHIAAAVRPWYLRGRFFVLVVVFLALIVGTLFLTRGLR